MSYGIYDLTDEVLPRHFIRYIFILSFPLQDIREKLSLLVRVANSVWKN